MNAFAPSRLAVARRLHGMTQKTLAERCNVSPQLISFFEKGSRTPNPEDVHKLAFALGFPLSFFYNEEIDLIDSEVPSFRARRSMTRRLRDSALASGEIASAIISPDLNERFVFPKLHLLELTDQSPEAAAELLRVEWKLGYGPISNMVHLLESKGIEAYWLNEDSPSVDAFSLWRDDKPFVVLNSNKNSGERSRFDAAHELGHLVLHKNIYNLDAYDRENEANDFASAFLMPRVQVEIEWPKRPELSALYRLKERWKVSVAAMIYRGRSVGIYSEWHARDAFKRLSASGMRLQEKEPVKVEQSLLHQKVFKSLSEKGISPENYAKQLSLSRDSLLELMPVASSYIENHPKDRVIQRGHLRLIS